MELRRIFFSYWRFILILALIEYTNGTEEAEETRQFGLDIIGNTLGIVASSLALIGQGTKFTGRFIILIVIPVAFAAGILVSVILVAAFLLIFNTIVIIAMFLMNLAMILGKLLYGRSGSQIINYPNLPPQPSLLQHFQPTIHDKILSPLGLKLLAGKKLFLIAKFLKFMAEKDPSFLKRLESVSFSEDQIRRNSDDFFLESLISSFNETSELNKFSDLNPQLSYRGQNSHGVQRIHLPEKNVNSQLSQSNFGA